MVFLNNVKKSFGFSKNFKFLDDLIHSGVKEIVLDSDIVLGWREEKKYWGGIKLDVDDLIIDGNGHTIDAKGKTRIFVCTGKNITIKNIILKNGHAKRNGQIKLDGAIYNYKGELTIISSTLIGNTAARFGGAISNYEGKLTISKSTFTENTAIHGGGAIYNSDGEVTITDSTLNNNTPHSIYNSDGEVTITDSTFTGNTAKSGGAIYNRDGEVTITDSTFTGNTAESGGAIYNSDGEVTITDSTFTGNTAQDDGGTILNRGNFKFFNCEFSSNNSSNNIILNNNSLKIHNTTFKDNQSKDIILSASDRANLGIFGGGFKENIIEQSILCNDGKFCSIEKTIFQNNISDNKMNIINNSELTLINPKIKDKGKTILNQNYILIRNSPPEIENKICGEGTVETIENRMSQREDFDFEYLDKKIHESNTKEIILDHDITFENYEIDYYEGGIELDIDNLIINGNGKIINGSDKSRIFIITGNNITLKNIIFKNGHSHKNYDNPLNDNGGAIRINHNSNITIENCEFINNTSEENGGAIDNRGDLTIIDSTLTENTSQHEGGAIDNRGDLTIIDSTLTENTSQHEGGAIDNRNASLTIIDSTLNNNSAISGGAIYNAAYGPWAIKYIKSSLTITSSTLTGNIAGSGGAIYNHNAILTITKSTLTGNTAGSGGAIDNEKGDLTIIDSTLTGNIAQGVLGGYGGAISNRNASLTITSSTLTGNTASTLGGAIRIIHTIYESENCTFKDNKPNDVI